MADKLAIAWRYIDDSEYQNDSLRQNIEESDNYYFGRLPGPPAESTGRSSSVSMDVQSMITATEASILDGLIAQQPARFKANGDQDALQADLESTAVTDIIMSDDGYTQLAGAIENSLRYQFCVARVFIDTEKITEKRVLPEAGAMELAQIQASIPDEFDAVIKDDTVSWTREIQRANVENIDPARLRYPKDHPSMDFQTMPFVAIEHRDLRADMLAMGFPKAVVDDLPKWSDGDWSESSIRSKLVAEERTYTDAPDPALDYIKWFECWLKVPQDDGTVELERIATAERKMLDNTPATFVPLAAGAAFLQPHRFQGISLASKVQPIQVSKTEARRQYEDNLESNNNPRSMTYDVDLSDAQNGRVNGIVRAQSPNSIYQPIAVQDLSSGSLGYLAYMDQVRAEVGGSALDMQQPESELMKSQIGAVASQSVLQSQEQLSVFISTNLASTFIKQLYLVTHRVLREDFTGQLQVTRADQVMTVDPRQWPERTRVTLTAGMSPTARNRKAANLMTVVQTQMGILQAGLPLTDPNGLHAALRDWAIASDLGNVNAYLTDPDSQKGQQMAQAAAQQAQQQQQMQQGMAQVQIQLEQGKLMMDKYTADIKAQVDVFKAQLQAEVDEAKLTLEGIQNAEKADIDRAQAAGQGIGQNNGAARPAGGA